MNHEYEIERRGIKKSTLAGVVGIPPATLSKFLRGDVGYVSDELRQRIETGIDQFPIVAELKARARQNPEPPVIIAISNHKGGTGKTTVAQNLAFGLNDRGFDVLMVDLDPQGHLSHVSGSAETDMHVGKLLNRDEKITFDQVVVHLRPANRAALDLLPGNQNLSIYEAVLMQDPSWQILLRNQIQDKDYRFVIVDCAPSVGILTMNALVAARYLIIPMQGENLPFLGLEKILTLADRVREFANPALELIGVLRVRFNLQTKLGQAIAKRITDTRLPIMGTMIRQDVGLAECTALQTSIFDYDPTGRGAQDMNALIDEVLATIGVDLPPNAAPEQTQSEAEPVTPTHHG